MCTDRKYMPQVDVKSYPHLERHFASHGIAVTKSDRDPHECYGIQCMPDTIKPSPPEVLEKPVLIANDQCVLDGNYRWMSCKILNRKMPVYVIHAPHVKAMELLYEFPLTYEYGDGDYHPISY